MRSAFFVPVIVMLLMSSCQNEGIELSGDADEQQLLVADSELFELLNDILEHDDNNGNMGSNDDDDDDDDTDQCVRFNYPFAAFVYNVDFQVIEAIDIRNKMNFEDFLEDLEENSLVAGFSFPITLLLENNISIEVNNNNELLQALEACE